ncbi:MAG: D-Ala-D-Ala carboxypeptidase family metallohydrolase [Sulfuricurvum sp.]|nr:D-Ala-D-Ala carboxypeptidase family metallohydrolase [Sulfuricurvum sp.]
MVNIQLTEHFSFNELTDSGAHPELVAQNRIEAQGYLKQLKHTAASLEEIRDALGVPLVVSSGFRNTALNNAVKGSATSKHKLGLCADFMPKGMDIHAAMEVLKKSNKLLSVRKVIFEGVKGKLWFHVQTKSIASEPTEFYVTSDGKNYTKVA